MLVAKCIVLQEDQDDSCGETHWKAARISDKGFAGLDETGLYVACCNHCIILKAINMLQGKIFANPLYIQSTLASKINIKFMCQDVICRYWPMLQKLLLKMPKDDHMQSLNTMTPFLSIMHGKAHSVNCQVRKPLWVVRTVHSSEAFQIISKSVKANSQPTCLTHGYAITQHTTQYIYIGDHLYGVFICKCRKCMHFMCFPRLSI